MKKILFFFTFCFLLFTYTVKSQTINDTTALRAAIVSDIVPNSNITATKLNRILQGNINALSKVGVTSFYRRADSVFYVKAGTETFAFKDSTGGGGGSVTSTDSSFYLTGGGTKINARWWYNVKDFGAVGDGVTSDVAAIQAAINYAFNNGGGKVFFPNGVYIIDNNPLHQPDSIPLTCQICIPFTRWNSDSSKFRTIELVGESISSPEQQAFMTFATPLNGAVLKSTWITTTGGPFGNPISVLGYVGTYEVGLFEQLNYTQFIVRDLSVLVSTKNTSGTEVQNIMSGINMSYFATGSLKGDVRIRSTSAPLGQLTPYTGSYGFISPTISNHAHMNNDNLTVSGFYTGAKLSEHTSFQTYIVGSTIYGLDIEPYYSIQISHFIEENNAHAIRVRNSATLVIGAYESESYTSTVTWFNKVADFKEYSANASGLISIQAGVWNAGGGARNPTIIGDSVKLRLHSDRYGNSYIPLTTNTTVGGLAYNQWRLDTTSNFLQRWNGNSWKNFGTGLVSQTLTDGATITWNINSGTIAKVTLGGNRTLVISNPVANNYYQISVTQDGTGSRTLTLPAGSKVIGGGAGAITLTTTAGAIDILTCFYDGTNYYWNYGKNYN